MPTANKVLIYRWFEEVWNKKRREAIFEMMHTDCLIYGLGENPVVAMKGPQAFLPLWEVYVRAFPDLHISVESTMAEEDKVMARCSMRGRHTGEGLGIPPTHKAVTISGMCLGYVKEGKFSEAWNNFDFLRLYQQLGMVPSIP